MTCSGAWKNGLLSMRPLAQQGKQLVQPGRATQGQIRKMMFRLHGNMFFLILRLMTPSVQTFQGICVVHKLGPSHITTKDQNFGTFDLAAGRAKCTTFIGNPKNPSLDPKGSFSLGFDKKS